MELKRTLCLRVLPLLLVATAISSAATVQILASSAGCVQCGTFSNIQPGDTVTFTGYTPAQIVNLAAGTYTITNAATSGTYSAWQATTGGNWYWDFGVANAATGYVYLADYVGTSPGVGANYSTQALMAGATGIKTYDGNTQLSATTTASFTDTLTLASQTTLDFYIMDASLANTAGGIALTFTQVQTGVPEPASFLLVGTVLAAACLRLRRRA
jgi:hypothetical protein